MNKNYYIILIIFSFFLTKVFAQELKIVVTVNNNIITNQDLEKEVKYLEILNPKLTELNKNKLYDLAKRSLINETIKENELKKNKNFNENKSYIENYLESLYSSLSFNSEEAFINELKKKNTYSLNEIKTKIKTELIWNELVFSRYNELIKIDKEKIEKQIDELNRNIQKEFLLSEIVFKKEKEIPLENTIQKILTSISEIGFNNTATIYSISDTSKKGGSLGWIPESNLPQLFLEKINSLNNNAFTEVIKVGNNFVIIQKENARTKELQIDKEKKFNELVNIETNRQLSKFSRILFDKIKINYSINEL
jgi:peptidyl-prolyl cis-trans isomerase SurA